MQKEAAGADAWGKGEGGGAGKSELAASREVVNWKANKIVSFAWQVEILEMTELRPYGYIFA